MQLSLWLGLALCLLAGGCGSDASDAQGEQRTVQPRQALSWGKADGTGCAGACGEQAVAGCWCDEKCLTFNDCCPDKVAVCDGQQPSCQGFCGERAPSGCYCDRECSKYGDCCLDKVEQCDTVDPCLEITCDSPPPPLCIDSETLRTFDAEGQCAAGSCTYSAKDQACSYGCADGNCAPPPPPVSDDPFDPASCPGAPMTSAQAMALFAPGSTSVTLSSYQFVRRQRACNAVTGCGPWKAVNPRQFRCASYSSISSSAGYVPLAGEIKLVVSGDKIRLQLADERGFGTMESCLEVGSDPMACDEYRCMGGKDSLGNTFSAGEIYLGAVYTEHPVQLKGQLTPGCLRLVDRYITDTYEDEMALLARF